MKNIPDELIAEASVWVARLHGPGRKEAEQGARTWMLKGQTYARAFELATESWEQTAGLARVVRLQRSPKVRMMKVGLSLAAAVAVMAVAVFGFVHFVGISTAVGEQRLVALEDGSRVTLNTSTRLLVRYDSGQRRIVLKTGEAWFQVAPGNRPFVVEVEGREVLALGTSFTVRRDEAGRPVSVTLLEGKVRVGADLILAPGERVTFVRDRAPVVDRPMIERVTAWRQGYMVLDDMPLPEAVAEMNRYSRRKLALERADATGLRVNGLFQTGDLGSFAAAVARTHGYRVVEEPRRIVLKKY